jgi:hypothetical protein
MRPDARARAQQAPTSLPQDDCPHLSPCPYPSHILSFRCQSDPVAPRHGPTDRKAVFMLTHHRGIPRYARSIAPILHRAPCRRCPGVKARLKLQNLRQIATCSAGRWPSIPLAHLASHGRMRAAVRSTQLKTCGKLRHDWAVALPLSRWWIVPSLSSVLMPVAGSTKSKTCGILRYARPVGARSFRQTQNPAAFCGMAGRLLRNSRLLAGEGPGGEVRSFALEGPSPHRPGMHSCPQPTSCCMLYVSGSRHRCVCASAHRLHRMSCGGSAYN